MSKNWGHAARRVIAVLFALMVLLAAMALALRPEPTTVPLPKGDEIEILHVTVGTNHTFSAEPLWRQIFRRVLPASMQARLATAPGETVSSRHSTLMLWLRVTASPNTARPLIAKPAALLHGTNTFPGRVSQINSNIFRLQFTVFAREQQSVPLRLYYGGADAVDFRIKNPAPVTSMTSPLAQPLPQTNDVGHTRIILRSLQSVPHRSEFVPLVSARSDPPAGWIQWSFTFFGDNGNWVDGRSIQRPMTALSQSSRLRVQALGTEYISTAFISIPGEGVCEALAQNRRAVLFGLGDVYLVGPGVHVISNGIVVARWNAAVPARIYYQPTPARNWSATVHMSSPGLFYWSEVPRGSAPPRLRIRERLPDGKGRIFVPTSRNTVCATNTIGNRMRVLSLYTPALPLTTTNLEVETIVSLPPADFFIALPR